MEQKRIGIDGITVPIVSGKPISFDGVFSGKKLSGIEVTLRTRDSTERKMMDDLLAKGKVTIDDPFVGRSYEASIRMCSNSFTVGQDDALYVLTAKELDQLPPFSSIELNGMEFPLLDYDEYITEDKVGRQALLWVSREQFPKLRDLLGRSPIAFRRVGVDETPLELRFGSGAYWSRHGAGAEEHYKQIVNLLPLDLEPSGLDWASGVTQKAMANILIPLVARFELLVKELAITNTISSQTRDALLSSLWRESFPSQKIDELYDSLDQVDDAAARFVRMGDR